MSSTRSSQTTPLVSEILGAIWRLSEESLEVIFEIEGIL